MSPVSLWPALIALALALIPAWIVMRLSKAVQPITRFSAIDGMRGFLAFSVFIHHAVIWYYYISTGNWDLPPSNFYTHLGQGAVVFFFMITSFLFTLKLRQAPGRKDLGWWTLLYISRVLRLAPLYLVMFAVMVILVGMKTAWTLKEPAEHLSSALLTWLAFTIDGQPDINRVRETGIMVARVPWSLVYEIYFYACLPVIACALATRKSLQYAALLAATVYALATYRYYWLAFCGGIFSALIFEAPRIKSFARTPLASLLISAFLVLIVWRFPSAYRATPILLMTLIFLLITAGNSLFGLLTTRLAIVFGEIAYSIYMLHGLLLYTAFKLLHLGVGWKIGTALGYWAVIWCLSPVLIALAYAAHAFVEKPPMEWSRSLAAARKNAKAVTPVALQP